MTDKKVVIYSTPTCPNCKRAKEYLSQKGISYQEHDVTVDKAAAREMIEKWKQMSVPLIIIDGKDMVLGFNQAKLDELLSS